MRKMIGKFFDKTFLKFIIVGLVNTLFGTAIMFLLYNVAGCSYWISSFANYFFGSILSYFLNKYFTFQNKERSARVVAKFVVNIAVCYLFAYGLAKPIVYVLLENTEKNVQENIAMFVGMILFVGLNYLGQRFFAFKSEEAE